MTFAFSVIYKLSIVFFFIIFGCCMFLLPVSKISLSCFRSKGRKLHMLECLTLQKQQIDLWYILVDKSWHFPRHLYDCYNVTLWRSSVCSLLLIHSFVRCSLLNLTLFSTLPFSQNNDTLISLFSWYHCNNMEIFCCLPYSSQSVGKQGDVHLNNHRLWIFVFVPIWRL